MRKKVKFLNIKCSSVEIRSQYFETKGKNFEKGFEIRRKK